MYLSIINSLRQLFRMSGIPLLGNIKNNTVNQLCSLWSEKCCRGDRIDFLPPLCVNQWSRQRQESCLFKVSELKLLPLSYGNNSRSKELCNTAKSSYCCCHNSVVIMPPGLSFFCQFCFPLPVFQLFSHPPFFPCFSGCIPFSSDPVSLFLLHRLVVPNKGYSSLDQSPDEKPLVALDTDRSKCRNESSLRFINTNLNNVLFFWLFTAMMILTCPDTLHQDTLLLR